MKGRKLPRANCWYGYVVGRQGAEELDSFKEASKMILRCTLLLPHTYSCLAPIVWWVCVTACW